MGRVTLDQFQSIVQVLERGGLVRRSAHVLYGTDLLAKEVKS